MSAQAARRVDAQALASGSSREVTQSSRRLYTSRMRDLVVYGLGELGQLYGAAALRAGFRVTPITRASDPTQVLGALSPDVPILVAVGEGALDGVLANLASAHAGSVILLQNELFPSQWRRHGIAPTVFVPWFLKKRGVPLLVARPTPVYGRHAALVHTLHEGLRIPAATLASEQALHQALVDKYAFILTSNVLGLLRDRTLALWLQEDPLRVRALAAEAAELGARLCESDVDRTETVRVVEEGMRALGAMSARGRTAGERLARALEHARRLDLTVPELTRAAHEDARRTV